MTGTPPEAIQFDRALIAATSRRQVRRAWLCLASAFLAFLVICGGFGGAGYWYRGHATEKRTVRVEIVQGDRAFVRPAFQRNWSALPARSATGGMPIELHEGDALQTKNGTQVLLTFWDNSTVQVFEDSELQMTELRSTQYISRASSITMTQSRGLSRVALAPGDYYRARFQVLAGDTTVLMKEGDGGAGGVFVVQVTVSDTTTDNPRVTVRASVRRGVGAVRVANYPEELRLAANEQTTVQPGQPAGAPEAARRDFIANSQFGPIGASGCDLKEQFAPWTARCTPGQIDGGFGRLATVRETLDGQDIAALEISRDLSSTDPANTGVKQLLDVGITDQPSLSLTADIKVFEQNIPGGGQSGSEFPIIVRINYYDAFGGANTRIWGFYMTPPPTGTIPTNPSLVEARSVTPGEWTPLRVELRGLVPQPVRLESIEVYASGQGYRARITNVAIIGAE
ncbi:MAG TPA: hypothetical protein VIL85_08365 [Thermomicrobiales bacterium]|jgi:hypothetical protein